MKKIILITLSIFVCASTFAQNNKVKNNKIRYYHETGINTSYFLDKFQEIYVLNENLVIPTKNMFGIGIYELHGIEFNPHFVLTLEIDAAFMYSFADFNYYNNNFQLLDVNDYIPSDVYRFRLLAGLDFKYIILKNRKWSPYLEIDYLNGILSTKTKDQIAYFGKYQDIRHTMSASIVVGATYNVKDRQSLSLGLGYSFPTNALQLKAGYRFR